MSGKKLLLLISGAIFVVFLVLCIVFIWPLQKKFNLIHTEVVNKTTLLRNFINRPKGLPRKREIGEISNEIKILEEKYIEIKKSFIFETEEKPAPTPVEFGDMLYERKRQLLQEASRAGAGLPLDLGFRETIPAVEEVADMVKHLENITFVIRKAIPFKIGDIKRIGYKGVVREIPWERLGIELEIHGDFRNIAAFLQNISHDKRIYVIKALDIRKTVVSSQPYKLKAGGESKFTPEKEKSGELKEEKITTDVSVAVRLEYCNYTGGHGD